MTSLLRVQRTMTLEVNKKLLHLTLPLGAINARKRYRRKNLTPN